MGIGWRRLSKATIGDMTISAIEHEMARLTLQERAGVIPLKLEDVLALEKETRGLSESVRLAFVERLNRLAIVARL
jgi:hypothetical protein